MRLPPCATRDNGFRDLPGLDPDFLIDVAWQRNGGHGDTCPRPVITIRPDLDNDNDIDA